MYAHHNCLNHVDIESLQNVTISPVQPLMVGQQGTNYYMIDHTLQRVEKITFGAFKHLEKTWKAWRTALERSI